LVANQELPGMVPDVQYEHLSCSCSQPEANLAVLEMQMMRQGMNATKQI
jgi:hypothetical protein